MFPIEIINHIYEYLSIWEINNISTVSRCFYNALHYHIKTLYMNNKDMRKYIYKIANDIKFNKPFLYVNTRQKCDICSDHERIGKGRKVLSGCNFDLIGELCNNCDKFCCYNNLGTCNDCNIHYCHTCAIINSCLKCGKNMSGYYVS